MMTETWYDRALESAPPVDAECEDPYCGVDVDSKDYDRAIANAVLDAVRGFIEHASQPEKYDMYAADMDKLAAAVKED